MWLLLLLLAGCTPTLKVELTPSADRLRWEREVTATVNDLDVRLKHLEVPNAHPAAR